jgi:hypothetical protein
MNLLPLIVSLGLSATPAPVPPFEFSPSTQLALTWSLPATAETGISDAGRAGVTPAALGSIDLLNNERVRRDILLDLQLRKQDGEPVDTARLVTLRPLDMAAGAAATGGTVLPAAGALRIQLLPRDAASAAPATLTGYLTASEASGQHVARVPVQLQLTRPANSAAPESTPLQATPLLASVTEQITTTPGCSVESAPHGERLWLPATDVQWPGQKDGALLPPKRLGALVGGQGGVAQVFLTGRYDEAQGLELSLGCMTPPGEYTGRIEFPSRGGTKQVDFKVSAKHPVGLAALTLGLGVLVAGVLQWFSTVRGERRRLEKRTAALSEQLQTALQDESLQPIRADAEKALEAWNTAFKQRLEKVKDFSSTSVEHQAVLAELTAMEQRIQAFERFPTLAKEAPAAVENALCHWPASIRPSTRPSQPAFIANLPSLTQPPTFEGAISQLEELQEVNAFAAVFDKAGTRLQHVQAWTQAQDAVQSPVLTLTETTKLQTARELQSKVRHDFWQAANLEELTERGTVAELKQAEALLANLDYRIPADRPKFEAILGFRGLLPTVFSLLTGEPETPGGRPNYAARAQRAGSLLMVSNLGVFFVSLAAAVVLGLQQFYFTKPFGLWSDYLQAFFWGVLTQVTLATAVGSIPQLLGSFKEGARR